MVGIERIKKNFEFTRVYKRGKSQSDKLLVVYVKKNGLSFNRYGISISKKVGKSNKRNKIKRRLKEILRNIDKSSFLKTGYDIVLVVRIGSRLATYKELSISYYQIITKLRILVDEMANDLSN